jgi:predicted amidohydrolase
MLRVSIIQTAIIWENPLENLENLTPKINQLPPTDVVVLPEMFTTGFTMQPEKVAETMQGTTVHWMREMAQKKQIALIGSLVIRENNKFYNRLIVALPTDEVLVYDKRHLFSYAGENHVYTAGNERLTFGFKGFKICPLICYDLRFPVFSRNTVAYDVLLYVANWPQKRLLAWNTLLKARAIENMCYVVAVNRIGECPNELYNGHSQIVDYVGNYIVEPFENEEIKTILLHKKLQEEARKTFGFLEDRDL